MSGKAHRSQRKRLSSQGAEEVLVIADIIGDIAEFCVTRGPEPGLMVRTRRSVEVFRSDDVMNWICLNESDLQAILEWLQENVPRARTT